MPEDNESNRLYFYAGPIIILISFYLLFQGYKALLYSSFGYLPQSINKSLAVLIVIGIYGLARYFERIFSASYKSSSWLKAILAGFIGLILVTLSALGVSNALYYAMAGRPVIENGVHVLTDRYDLMAEETRRMSATPVLDQLTARIKAPLDRLAAEIVSVNCGMGPGARDAIEEIRRELGPSFKALNFNRVPRCDDKPALQRLAQDYRDHVRQQLLAVPDVLAERSTEKVALNQLVSTNHGSFRTQASQIIELANEAARTVNFFGSRDGFNPSIQRLVRLQETFLNDRTIDAERAQQFTRAYSQQVLAPLDLEQEKALGNFWSLYLALINLNPWYVLIFILGAVGLDAALIAWFHYTRVRIFADRSIMLVGLARKRVRYLWTPPITKEEN